MGGAAMGEQAAQPAESETGAQWAFVERLTVALGADERVLAIWLMGSLARGTADRYSDVDTRIAVRDAEFPAVVEGWRELVDRVGPTVMRRRFGPPDDPIVTAITPDWLRFDIAIQPASSTKGRGYDVARLLFDRDGTGARSRVTAAAPPDPLARLPSVVEEFIRGLGLLPVVIGRGEFFVAMFGATILHNHLHDLMLMETGSRRHGAQRLNPLLTGEQRQALAALPHPMPDRASLIESHLACARLFLPRARKLMGEHGLPYPEEFERALARHLRRALGVTL
jgi:predicted nucleotidyltransferase